jgi:hypothetical protein
MILVAYVVSSLLYAVTYFVSDFNAVCVTAENPLTCESVNSTTGGVILFLAFAQAIIAAMVFLAIPGLSVAAKSSWVME